MTVLAVAGALACSSSGSGASDGGAGHPEASTSSSGSGSTTDSGSNSDSGSSSGSGSSGGDGSGGADAGSGWQPLALVEETYDGGSTHHAAYDTITGIRFTSTSSGWVSTSTVDPDSTNGGAIFGVSSSTLSVLASGTAYGGYQQGIDFLGVFGGNGASQEVIGATDSVGKAALSTNGGVTFSDGLTGSGFENAANAGLGYSEDSAGNWYVADIAGGYLYKAAANPGATTAWKDITPPSTACDAPSPSHGDPHGGGNGMHMYVSPDGQTIVYPLASTTTPLGACVTHDAGGTWKAVNPPNPPSPQPQGYDVYATANGTLLLYAGDDLTGDVAAVYRSTDGGSTWKASTIPAQGSTLFDFDGMFFAPDSTTGWIIGRTSADDASPTPLLFKTTDGGVTWSDITVHSFSGSVLDPVNGGPWMHVGFALDANDIWIGGANGTLLHNTNGGL